MEQKVSIREKICYAMGDVSANIEGGRGPGTNDTVKRYSRGGFVMVGPSVRRLRRPVAGRLIAVRGAYCAPAENMS